MTKNRKLKLAAVSISNSPDLKHLGLTEEYLRVAMSDIALYLLAMNLNVAYGGDLRPSGFTQYLFELSSRYSHRGESEPRIRNYLAWPVHSSMERDELINLYENFHGQADIITLGKKGEKLEFQECLKNSQKKPTAAEWRTGLTAMREVMNSDIDIHVLLGGQISGYKGSIPGIAEEARLSLKAKKPLFILGGFGGCARDIAESMGLIDRRSNSCQHELWPGQTEFKRWTHHDLNNGLTEDENMELASTSFIEKIIILMLRGIQDIQLPSNNENN